MNSWPAKCRQARTSIIMIVGYRTDAVAVRQPLHHPVRYLSLMGSTAKIAHLLQSCAPPVSTKQR
ncbi:hypothetical protein O3303_19240 [Hymenobacter canadensis]|uniref:Uncharacterized protein n=1 Tax=Hymenobacter canadensis TaxID=2999067 RepID=A0ABY7LNB8_9BACT|nr:hypothetical protein [Hymenobacter canadensis]WBA41931.1 hypothetical protein O3303_19240 [Hymenobacter canadensis]